MHAARESEECDKRSHPKEAFSVILKGKKIGVHAQTVRKKKHN